MIRFNVSPAQVSHLTAITKQPLQKRLHDLQQPALNLMVAVQNLAMKSRDMTEETSDKASNNIKLI